MDGAAIDAEHGRPDADAAGRHDHRSLAEHVQGQLGHRRDHDGDQRYSICGDPDYINIIDGIPGNVGPGAYAGLQGEDEGQSNDIQLADGTVLPQPVTSAELYGEYANSWAVSSATSLFDGADSCPPARPPIR